METAACRTPIPGTTGPFLRQVAYRNGRHKGKAERGVVLGWRCGAGRGVMWGGRVKSK